MWHIRESHGVKYLLSDSALAGGFVAGFTTRLGGVSSLSYSSLNLGLHVGDARERVITNRRRFAAALGVDLGCMVFAEQVHSNRVEIVNTQHCGMGVLEQETAVSKTDGLITSEAGVMLVLTFADCVPVILFEPESSVAAVVHAGSRHGSLYCQDRSLADHGQVQGESDIYPSIDRAVNRPVLLRGFL